MIGERPRWQVEWHATLGSTMDRARDLAAAGAPAGTVVVADEQTAGRGRRGRPWLAPRGASLMFTLITRPAVPPATLEDLPLRVSEAVARFASEELGVACRVKPPNDVVTERGKLCGVLCTSHVVGDVVAWVLVGIGLNTQMSLSQRPLDTATSLQIEGVDPVPSHEELLPRLLARLEWLLGPGA